LASADFFLFVSHVAEDRSSAMELVDELERRGARCWIAPRDIRPGMPFDDAIADAIESSRAMLLIFSELCNESEYIRREVTVAGESHKTVIPFRIENVQPRKGLRIRLSDLHWIDGFVSRERAIDEVINDLHRPDSAAPALRDDGERKIPNVEVEPKPADTISDAPQMIAAATVAADHTEVLSESAPVDTLDGPRETGPTPPAGDPVHFEPTDLSDGLDRDAGGVSHTLGKPAGGPRTKRWPILTGGAIVMVILILIAVTRDRAMPTAKINDAPAVGTAGGNDKCDYVRNEPGLDECLNHRDPDLAVSTPQSAGDDIKKIVDEDRQKQEKVRQRIHQDIEQKLQKQMLDAQKR
jgi:TIR domain